MGRIRRVNVLCETHSSYDRYNNLLAAMSSSRRDVVTQFVRLCFPPSVCFFFLLVSLKFLLGLKSFNGVSRQFKECLKFNGSLKAVSRKF